MLQLENNRASICIIILWHAFIYSSFYRMKGPVLSVTEWLKHLHTVVFSHPADLELLMASLGLGHSYPLQNGWR